MATQLAVGTKALPVPATKKDPATIVNAGTGTVYYATAQDVRPDPKAGHGSIAGGQKVEVKGPQWVVASASTRVLILRNADREDT